MVSFTPQSHFLFLMDSFCKSTSPTAFAQRTAFVTINSDRINSSGKSVSPTVCANRTAFVKPNSDRQYQESDLYLTTNLSKTFDINMVRFILKHNLKKIVPQIQCEHYQRLSAIYRQGIENLMHHSEDSYCFYPPDVRELASDIDMLHSNDIFHRGISPYNMVFFEVNMYLFTENSIGKCDSRDTSFTTRFFTAPELLSHTENTELSKEQCKKRDQYNFFISIMTIDLKSMPDNGKFDSQSISDFIEYMGIPEHLQDELFQFLTQPALNCLSRPLRDYVEVDEIAPLTADQLPNDESSDLKASDMVNEHFLYLSYSSYIKRLNASTSVRNKLTQIGDVIYQNEYSISDLEKYRDHHSGLCNFLPF